MRVRTEQEIVENTVRKRRMKWYGHISRMNKERWPSIVHNWKPTGKRPVGRPKQRWMDNIEKDLKRASLSLYGITTGRNRVRLEELVGDRERWKDITAASMAGWTYWITTWPYLIKVSDTQPHNSSPVPSNMPMTCPPRDIPTLEMRQQATLAPRDIEL